MMIITGTIPSLLGIPLPNDLSIASSSKLDRTGKLRILPIKSFLMYNGTSLTSE